MEKDIFDTYISVIKNSVGTKMFRNFFVVENGKKKDAMKNGVLSCAYFVSFILCALGFIKRIHGTVDSAVKDLKESGWAEIKAPKVGSVLVWEEKDFGDGDTHKHIGFYIGDNKAISNSFKFKTPIKHHYTFGTVKGKPKRKIEAIFWNSKIS